MYQHETRTRPYLHRACKNEPLPRQLSYNEEYIKCVKTLFELNFPNWLQIKPRNIKSYKSPLYMRAYSLEIRPVGEHPFVGIIANIMSLYSLHSRDIGICVDIREFNSEHVTMAITIVSVL